MTYGYARCSTRDKQDTERQLRELTRMGADDIGHEYASGTIAKRAELLTTLAKLETGDTIAVTEMSRLTRSLRHLCDLLELFESVKIIFKCGTITADYTKVVSPMQKAMLQIMGVFAELERGMTVERIKSGLENAIANGATVGRPKKTKKDIPSQVLKLLPQYMAGEFGKTEYAKLAGVSRSALYKYLRLLDKQKPDKNPPRRKSTGRPALTEADIPQKVIELLPDYKNGRMTKIEYAKRVNISRTTLDKYLKLLDGDA